MPLPSSATRMRAWQAYSPSTVGASQTRLCGCLETSENSASVRSAPAPLSISPLHPDRETTAKQNETARILRAVVGMYPPSRPPGLSLSKPHATTTPPPKGICRHFKYRENRFDILYLKC